MDRKAVEAAAAAQLARAVRTVHDQHPDHIIYGAMFHGFYGDGSTIAWPMVTVGTEESLTEVVAGYALRHGESEDLNESLRWSGPDLEHGFDPGAEEDALTDAIQAEVGPALDAWERTYDGFLLCFPRAAKAARKQLLAEGIVPKHFIAIAADEAGELVPLSLTKAQVLAHFPQYDAAERERRRLADLPVEERVAELLPEAVTPRYQGPLIGEHEELLVACGAAAVPALVRVVRGEAFGNGDVTAARLLAEINVDDADAVSALDELMRRRKRPLNSRAWAASALARLGRSDLILARVAALPVEVVTRGISDPFRSFRDRGAHSVLDYAPLEQVLREHPDLEDAFAEELEPGVGYCALTAEEIPIAEAALDSPWQVVRTHAQHVLKDARRR